MGLKIVSQEQWSIAGLTVRVLRKRVKNYTLRISRVDGHVVITAPLHVREDDIQHVILTKLAWIKQKQNSLKHHQSQQYPMEPLESGSTVLLFGQPLTLKVITEASKKQIEWVDQQLCFYEKSVASQAERLDSLQAWYRSALKARLPVLIQTWEPVIGVDVAEWGVKRMRTRWGSCNIQARRIWVNLELATKPVRCLEYVVVHEMVHLLERHHNARFKALLNQFFPGWREVEKTLNSM
ncbi:MAG: M48 family metallopeptidase [Gammaproteobacteria bacterium]|nr:M48 family metallopeptidase [Gammaproteobacteria bacterium]